ncbi:GATA-type domain-containing protein [Entamoeba marina]
MQTDKMQTEFEDRIPDLPTNAVFSCNFKLVTCEMLAALVDKELTPEQFVSARMRIISLFENYNKLLYKGTTLEAPQPVVHHQSRPPSDASASNGQKRRGRPRLDHNRECFHCHTRQTSEWRTGEVPNTFLCNACGLKVLKKRKREQQMANMNATTYASSGQYSTQP